MTKKHEELVEEIREILDMYLMVPGSSKGAKVFLPIAGARHLITHFISAIRDGRLDKELGVVGRGWAWRDKKNPRFRIVGDDSENPSGWRLENARLQSFQDLYDVDRFELIALTGTGKEE